MRDRFGIFGAVIRNRKLSLLLVMTLRIPNNVPIFLMVSLKILILSSNFSGTVPTDIQVGTRRKNTFNTSRNLLHMRLRLKVMR